MIDALIAFALAGEAPALEPLDFLVGHCWEGEFADGSRDRHCFESVYEGRHVRDRHEVTGSDGLYRGETLYSVENGRVGFTYWNSLGGVSRGTVQAQGDRLSFGNEIYKGPDGGEALISSYWRRAGADAYEAVTVSREMPSMNRTVRYVRVPGETVAISSRTDPDGTHALVHETTLAATGAEAWQAISTAEGWKTWAVPVAWLDGDILETSYAAGAAPGDRTTIRQQILARIPGRLIVFRTIKAPEGFPHFETFRAVTHLIELEPAGPRQTRIRLTTAGYADNEAGRRLLDFFREGNRITLERMQQRFVSGPLDWSRMLSRR